MTAHREDVLQEAWLHAYRYGQAFDRDALNRRLRRLRRLRDRAVPNSHWRWLCHAWISGLKKARRDVSPDDYGLTVRESYLDHSGDMPSWALGDRIARLVELGKIADEHRTPRFSATWQVIRNGQILDCDAVLETDGTLDAEGVRSLTVELWHTWRGTPQRMDYLGCYPTFAAARAATQA